MRADRGAAVIAPAAIACMCQGAAVWHTEHVQLAKGNTVELDAFLLVTGAWLLIISLALLVLRAVISEPLGSEQDESDDQVSGHVPSE